MNTTSPRLRTPRLANAPLTEPLEADDVRGDLQIPIPCLEYLKVAVGIMTAATFVPKSHEISQ